MEIGNLEDLMLGFKLEFSVKDWKMYTKQLPTNLGCPFGAGGRVAVNCLVVFQNIFFPFNPSITL